QDGVGGAHHPPAERHRRRLPERAQPDQEPRHGDEGAALAALRPRDAEARRRAGRARGKEDGQRLGEPDPQLCPPPLPHGQGPPHRRRGRRRRPRARRQPRPLHRGLAEGPDGHAGRDPVLTPLRLDYVSPLPPVRTGIADYSLDLLPFLAALADVRLVRLPGQPVDPAVALRWPLVEAGETGTGGRLPLYQMGNNRHHEGVLELALRIPGVLTLHDVVLHHLLLDVTLGRGVFPPYRERLTRDHGWIGDAASRAKKWHAYGDAPVFALPAHRTL